MAAPTKSPANAGARQRHRPRPNDRQSFRELLLEVVDDIDAIGKEIIQFVTERNGRHNADGRQMQSGNDGETLLTYIKLFGEKQSEFRGLLDLAQEYNDREELIRQLEACVENRDAIIRVYQENLKNAEMCLAQSIFEANQKLKKVAEADEHPVNSEDVIRFAHQISRSYSVAAPLFWQQGDPSRPFPTEAEFRQSSISNPRTAYPSMAPSVSGMLRGSAAQQFQMRSPQLSGRLGSSPGQMGQFSQRSWSPRTTGYSSSSPRGRGGLTPSSGRPETSPFAGRGRPPASSSTAYSAPKRPAPSSSQAEQMSSDSSSSSSSDEGSPS